MLFSAPFFPGQLYGFVELFSFSGQPLNPYAGMVQGTDGNFYGTTAYGGANGDGTVSEMTSTGVLTTLVSFSGSNGSNPYAGLAQDSDGNFYGTTIYGGTSGDGTVFKVTPGGVLTTLLSFNGANGSEPLAGLIQGIDGNFYGTTSVDGSLGGGNIFRIDSLQSSPPMTAATDSSHIIVSWPEDYPAFTLQTATNLNPPVNWLDVTNSPALLNGQFTVTNSLAGAKFYRLRY